MYFEDGYWAKAYNRLQSILEGQSDLIFRISPDQKYTFANKAYAGLYGKEPNDLIGKSIWGIIPENKQGIILDFILKINSQNPVGILETNINGLEVHWVAKAIFNQRGEIIEYQASGRDITELRNDQRELRQEHDALEQQVAERTQKLKKLNENLENEILERTTTELLLRKRYEIEKVLLKISSRFIKVLDIEQALFNALKEIGSIYEADRSYIFLFKEDGTMLVNTHEWCAPGVTPQVADFKGCCCEFLPWWTAKIKANQNISLTDISKIPEEARKEKELLGKSDIKSLIALPLSAKGEIIGFVGLDEVDNVNNWVEADFTILRLFSEIVGNALERNMSRQELTDSNKKLQKLVDDTVDLLASTVGMVDPYTANHQHSVAEIACKIAWQMGLKEKKIQLIKVAALLHDIGKLHVPASILSKPSKLTKSEFNLIKEHTQMGYDILKKANFSWPVAEIVLQHHERLDGSGYPAGKKADEILLEAKIIAVADVVEAMCSHRPYRAALKKEIAKTEIKGNKGLKYDSAVVDACLEVFFKDGFWLENEE